MPSWPLGTLKSLHLASVPFFITRVRFVHLRSLAFGVIQAAARH